jgi:hypothetical protein
MEFRLAQLEHAAEAIIVSSLAFGHAAGVRTEPCGGVGMKLGDIEPLIILGLAMASFALGLAASALMR